MLEVTFAVLYKKCRTQKKRNHYIKDSDLIFRVLLDGVTNMESPLNKSRRGELKCRIRFNQTVSQHRAGFDKDDDMYIGPTLNKITCKHKSRRYF